MNKEEFIEKLNAIHQWPSLYMFKFIVPAEQVGAVKQVFKNHSATEKASSKGKYISVTIQMMASHADEIIEKYEEAAKIKGIISL